MQVEFNLRLPYGVQKFNVFTYNKGQMHLPAFDKKFGSSHIEVSHPDIYGQWTDLDTNYLLDKDRISEKNINTYQYRSEYELSRTHWKEVDHNFQRCDENTKVGNTTKCIANYLEGKIGCFIGLQGSNRTMKRYFPILI